jgi:hypothetical protein
MKEPRKKPSLRDQWASISLEQKLAMFVAPVVVFCCHHDVDPSSPGCGLGWVHYQTDCDRTPNHDYTHDYDPRGALPHHRGAIPGHRLGIGSVVGARGRGCRTLR